MANDVIDLKAILALRETDGSVAGIGDAITRAEQARETAHDQIEESKRRARDLLMVGTITEIKAAESRAEEAGLAADRLSIVVEQLRVQLRAAHVREQANTAGALRAAALEADATFAKAWPKHVAALESLATIHNALQHRFAAIQAAAGAGAVPDALPGSDAVPSQELQTILAAVSQFAPSMIAAARAWGAQQDEAELSRRQAVASALRAPDGAQELVISAPEPRGRTAAPDPIAAILADPYSL